MKKQRLFLTALCFLAIGTTACGSAGRAASNSNKNSAVQEIEEETLSAEEEEEVQRIVKQLQNPPSIQEVRDAAYGRRDSKAEDSAAASKVSETWQTAGQSEVIALGKAAEEQSVHAQGTVPLHPVVYHYERPSYAEGSQASGNPIQVSNQIFAAIELPAEESQLYPQLAAALEQWNQKTLQDADAVQQEFAEGVAAQYAYSMEQYGSFTPYYDEQQVTIQRADSQFLTWNTHIEWYAGGVANSEDEAVSFHVPTGKQVEFDDLSDDLEALISAVKEELYETYSAEYGYPEDYLEPYQVDAFFNDPELYGLPDVAVGTEGVTIYFNSYALNCGAYGPQEVELSFKEYGSLFKDFVKS